MIRFFPVLALVACLPDLESSVEQLCAHAVSCHPDQPSLRVPCPEESQAYSDCVDSFL